MKVRDHRNLVFLVLHKSNKTVKPTKYFAQSVTAARLNSTAYKYHANDLLESMPVCECRLTHFIIFNRELRYIYIYSISSATANQCNIKFLLP